MKSFYEYNIGNTPLHYASKYDSNGEIYLKLEMLNPLGSIKTRTAYYMLRDLYDSNKLNSETIIVESTSGNLGISLSFFAKEFGVRFLCLIDPTIRPGKLAELKKINTEILEVNKLGNLDYRSSRIKLANELNEQKNYIWINQYQNLSNVKAHYETTGPEIWFQTNGKIDYLISTIGSGGTLSGIALYFKEQNPNIKIVGVEPLGSCIFGGMPDNYINAGAGMAEPSEITKMYFHLIDEMYKVKDIDAIRECKEFYNKEGIIVGHTTGMCLCVAKNIQKNVKNVNIIIIAPDSDCINL